MIIRLFSTSLTIGAIPGVASLLNLIDGGKTPMLPFNGSFIIHIKDECNRQALEWMDANAEQCPTAMGITVYRMKGQSGPLFPKSTAETLAEPQAAEPEPQPDNAPIPPPMPPAQPSIIPAEETDQEANGEEFETTDDNDDNESIEGDVVADADCPNHEVVDPEKMKDNHRLEQINLCVTNQMSSIEDLRLKMVNAIRTYNDLLEDKNKALKSIDSILEYIDRVDGSQKKIPKISSIKVVYMGNNSFEMDEGNYLAIYTDELSAKDGKGFERILGRFVIYFQPYADSEFITIFNLDRRVPHGDDFMQAPHVYGDGRSCFGNVEEIIAPVIANNDLEQICDVLLRFLTTPNLDDGPTPEILSEFPIKETASA